MEREQITFEIAVLAKERGFNVPTVYYYTLNYPDKLRHTTNYNLVDNEWDDTASAPTYHQLIDWVWQYVHTGSRTKLEHLIWLELWYGTLKDCPLKGEFIYRLMGWFRDNNIGSIETVNKGICVKGMKIEDTFFGYEQAEHEGIIQTFKLLKDE